MFDSLDRSPSLSGQLGVTLSYPKQNAGRRRSQQERDFSNADVVKVHLKALGLNIIRITWLGVAETATTIMAGVTFKAKTTAVSNCI